VPDLCRLARGGEEAQAPVLQQRTKLFEIPSSEVWTHKIMRLNERYFAFAATTEDIVCEKYMARLHGRLRGSIPRRERHGPLRDVGENTAR
jgi:hypothetical protein